jgi:hypothetical protein
MKTKLTILFSGMIAADPHQGGATWAVLQYLLGFKRLGHEIYFVEPLTNGHLRPQGTPLTGSENANYFREVMREAGLIDTSALLLEGTKETVGLAYDRIKQISERADLLINISGMLKDENLTGAVPARVYLDLDPAFNQLWHAADGIDVGFDGHTRFVTVGEEIGQPRCSVPVCGRKWLTTKQPIVLSEWPFANGNRQHGLTAIGNWRGYGSIEHGGVFYGQKAHSLRPLFELPRLTNEKFTLAFSIHPDEKRDLAALEINGWDLIDPSVAAGTPAKYRQFIQTSKAEFGIAKSGYVESQCGWFSDRSVCYLASGRPVIAQETGFGHHLPSGEGLFSFRVGTDVLTALEEINRDYARHSRAARAIAEEYFDSDKVLTRLLDSVVS